MTKSNLKAKNISEVALEDKIDAINIIVNSYFHENIDGKIEYTPYLSEMGKIIAIAKYLIDGLEFDKNDRIYDSVKNDNDVKSVINDVLSSQDFNSIMSDVKDIVEYKKSENIAKLQNETHSAVAYKLLELIKNEHEKTMKETDAIDNLNQWINEQRELNSLITPEMQRKFAENFDPSALTDSIIKKYTESDLHKRNKEVIESSRQLREKDNKIIELKNELARKEQKENVKNVIADK